MARRTLRPTGPACSLLLSAASLACTSASTAPQGSAAPAGSNVAAVSSVTPDGTTAATPCAPAGGAFCWLNPLPQGSTLEGAWLARADEGWAVGPVGSVLHWDGATLTPVSIPVTVPLRAIWGSRTQDVWAVGDAVLHYDGTSWRVASGVPAGTWNAVHGTSATDVWLAGTAGTVAHYDGRGWARVDITATGDLGAVAASAPGEAYASTARGGTVFRWDGTSWSTAAELATSSLSGLFAAGPGDVWAAGEPRDVNAAAGVRGTALAHLSGGTWESVVVPGLETATFTAVTGTAGGEVWAMALTGADTGQAAHLDVSGWHVEPLPPPALPPRAVSVTDGTVLAVGDGGQAFAASHAIWRAVHHGTPGYLQAASVTPAGDAWFGSVLPDGSQAQGKLLHVVAGTTSAVPVGVADVVYGVWANGPGDVWAGSLQNGFLRFDGQSWTARVGGYAGLVDGVWASSATDVWGVAGSYAVHFDGASVTRHPLPGGGARRIFGISPRDVWTVGGSGVVQHWDGARWSAVAISGGPALGVWGSSSDDVWMVGEGGLALHWDGHALVPVETGTTATLWSVSGTGKGDVWAVGAGGTVLHFDGNSFSPVPSGTRNALGAVALSASGDVYVGGDFGTILRGAR